MSLKEDVMSRSRNGSIISFKTTGSKALQPIVKELADESVEEKDSTIENDMLDEDKVQRKETLFGILEIRVNIMRTAEFK